MSLIAINLALTGFMTGIIWFVQVVHYPLMQEVLEPNFRGYENEHVRKTMHVVVPIMGLELAAAGALAILHPAWLSPYLAWGLFSVVVLIWLSTFFVQAPCHQRLLSGFSLSAHRRLLNTNWIRVGLWTLRLVVLSFISTEVFTI